MPASLLRTLKDVVRSLLTLSKSGLPTAIALCFLASLNRPGNRGGWLG
jgi:hypothetical protein